MTEKKGMMYMRHIKTIRKTRKDIIKAILRIALEVAKIVGTAIGATLFLILEAIAHGSRFGLFSIFMHDDLADDDFLSFEMYEYIGEFAENIKDQIDTIQVALLDIKETKEEKIELKKEEEKKALLTTKDFNDDIIEYIRNILIKLNGLPQEEQRLFTEKLKEILTDYTSKYFDALKNPSSAPLAQDTALLVRQTALDKLVTIDLAVSSRIKIHNKISAISLEEKEVLSMMQSSGETSPLQEGQKLEMRM